MPDCQKIYGALKDSQVHGHNRCMRRLPATCVRFGCSNIGVLYAGRAQPLYLLTPSGRFGPSAQVPTGHALPFAPFRRSQRSRRLRSPQRRPMPQRAVKGQGPFDASERIPRNEGGEARAAAHGGQRTILWHEKGEIASYFPSSDQRMHDTNSADG